jgi:hypothetical protein
METKREIAAWVMPLVGHEFDFEDLPLWLAGQECTRRETRWRVCIDHSLVGHRRQL